MMYQLRITRSSHFHKKQAVKTHSCPLQTVWKIALDSAVQYTTGNYDSSVQIIISLTNVHKRLRSILYFQ